VANPGSSSWCLRRRLDVLFLPAANRRVPACAPCPMVGTVHDYSSIHMESKYDLARYTYITRVLPFLARRLTRVIAVSESTRCDVTNYAHVPRERVDVVMHGVDGAVYHPRDAAQTRARVSEMFGVKAPYLLYISRLEHPGKNHVRLIEAFVRLKYREDAPHRLVLVGSDWSRAAEVHAAATQSPAARDIVFTGFAPGDELPYLYAGADAFVFPSLYEGFGMPILEALACGVPVVCANNSSLPEVAGDAAILFDPYSVEEMANAMARLIRDSALRDDLVRKGLARAAGFTWAATARQTLAVLHEAAAMRWRG